MIAAATSAGLFTGHNLETIARREFTTSAVIIPGPIPGQQLVVAPVQGELRNRKAPRPWAVLATVYATRTYGHSDGARGRALSRVADQAEQTVLAEIRHLATNGRQFTSTLAEPETTTTQEESTP